MSAKLGRGPSRQWAQAAALGLVLTLALALGACAIPQAQKAAPGEARLMQQNLSGRISVLTGEPPEQKNLYGGFRLELLAGGAGRFDVFSPLGQMLAQASWTQQSASLNDGRQTQDFPSFEDMTRAALGVALPRAALQNWVRGEPAASLPFTRLADGAFEQLGWRVQPRFEQGRLHVLRATRMQGPAAQLSLVVDETQVEHAAGASTPAVATTTAAAASAPAVVKPASP